MPGGRPPKDIDLEEIERMARTFCTEAEIAYVVGLRPDSFSHRKGREPELAQAIEKGRADGRRSLRQKQYVMAMNGNVTMLIWLGKQYLDQSDRHEIKAAGIRTVEDLTDEELLEIAARGKPAKKKDADGDSG